MHHLNSSKVLFVLCLLAFCAFAQNLIKDADVNIKPLSQEFKPSEDKSQGTLELFTEDATWNQCLKLELKKFGQSGDVYSSNFGVTIGGDAKTYGFPCKPGAKYNFSLEAKGTATQILLLYKEWDDKGKATKKNTSIHVFKPQKDWTVYKGIFTTAQNSKRAALVVQFWDARSKEPAKMKNKLGDYVLIDKITVEEADEHSVFEAKPQAAVPRKGALPVVLMAADNAENAAWHAGFRDLLEDKPARFPSKVRVYADDKAMHIDLQYRGAAPVVKQAEDGSRQIWYNDLAEIFIENKANKLLYNQFVVTAGGGRWMSAVNKKADFKSWTANVKVLADGWDASISLPYECLGLAGKPAQGTYLKFNVCREHRVPGPFEALDPSKGNRRSEFDIVDDSSMVFCGGKYADQSKWAVLFFGNMQKYVDEVLAKLKNQEFIAKAKAVSLANPGQAMAEFETLLEADRMYSLSKEKFIVAEVPVFKDTNIPFLPVELNNPKTEVKIRAAVNEKRPVAFALANMENEYNEYRVNLAYGWRRLEPQNEYYTLAKGLSSAEGVQFPKEKITLKRGVLYRDASTGQPGRRYDLLEELPPSGAMPVPARQAALLWIDFDCKGVKPGIYKGQLRVTPLGNNGFKKYRHVKDGMAIEDETKVISIELEVLPFELKEADYPLNAFRTAFTQYQYDFMKEYGCIMYMVQPWYFCCTFDADGNITATNPKEFLVPHIRFLKRNIGEGIPGHKKIFFAYSAYPVFKRVHVGRDNKHLAYDTPQYWNAYRNWLKYVDRLLAENGFSRSDYTVELIDEPNPNSTNNDEMLKIFTEAKKAIPDLNVTATNGERNYFDLVQAYTDKWIFSQHIFSEEKERAKTKAFRKAGKQVSMYACGTSMRQDCYRYYRLIAWKAANVGGDFVSIYQMFSQQPGMDFSKDMGDVLAYDTGDRMLPSVRLENLLVGINDIRYLRVLERLAQGDAKEAKEARSFLSKATREVAQAKPHDASVADAIRQQAIELILKLQK
ncbi:MAG: hypothetical protein J5746_03880 [Victivallales bacterium]|nr:hypothetical protein [Victivallales bacterium]